MCRVLFTENKSRRKLQNIRKLWKAVLEVKKIPDIFSKENLSFSESEIDHFVPRSYISNDEQISNI